METAKGNLKNNKTGDSLAFQVNPTNLKIEKNFSYAVEPRLGQGQPLIAFQAGGLQSLSFSLFFDKDIDSACDPKTIFEFVKSLAEIDQDTKSTPTVSFCWGLLTSFDGYIERYCLETLRFDRQGQPTSVKLDMLLIQGELAE